jgi:hypothetical protein
LTNQATALGYDALSERDLKEALLALATAAAPPSSNAQTLANLSASLNYPGLSQRGVWIALAGYYANLTATKAQTAVNTAAANNYRALSDFDLDASLLAIIA